MAMATKIYKSKIKMRKILLLAILQILIFNCKTTGQNIHNMEKINLKKFQNKELVLNKLYKEEVNDTVIEYGIFGNEIIENISYKENPYNVKKTYYKSNNQLKAESEYFYRVPINVSKKYDENGKLLEEKKWEKVEKRTFSIENLIQKMKDDFNIDLLKNKDVGVSCSGSPLAYVIGIHPQHTTFFRLIKINAHTGELISDETLEYEK